MAQRPDHNYFTYLHPSPSPSPAGALSVFFNDSGDDNTTVPLTTGEPRPWIGTYTENRAPWFIFCVVLLCLYGIVFVYAATQFVRILIYGCVNVSFFQTFLRSLAAFGRHLGTTTAGHVPCLSGLISAIREHLGISFDRIMSVSWASPSFGCSCACSSLRSA
jgi:hypothetical protein